VKQPLQPSVANSLLWIATFRYMDELGEYWKRICAPKLKARKEALGRAVPEREIAAYVESKSGKPTTRALISLFLLGKREPYISQFIALCQKLDMSPTDVISAPSNYRSVARRVNERAAPQRIVVRKRVKGNQ
jgi:hypothetical protein